MQAQKLTADDGAMNDNFGISAVVLGTTMFVGAHAAAVDSNPAQGAVYVFEYDGSTWNQVAEAHRDERRRIRLFRHQPCVRRHDAADRSDGLGRARRGLRVCE
jgi:hypothetical protein